MSEKSGSKALYFEYETKDTAFHTTWDRKTFQRNSTWRLQSQSHKYPYSGGTDRGGHFFLIKDEMEATLKQMDTPTYRGPAYASTPVSLNLWAQADAINSLSDSELNALGTTAIARSLPTNPAFSLSTFIGELREGVPRIIGSTFLRDKTRIARNSGSEYLNVEFGWKPLIADVRKFAYAVKESEKILSQYRRNSDKQIRKRYHFPVKDSFRQYSGSGCTLQPYSNWTGKSLSGTARESVTHETWFSGAFRYHIPTSDSQVGKMKAWASQADKLLGIQVTPEVLWNLSPWTWAADWFANTGDIMTNVSRLGKDGLVMRYGYIMNERKRETVIDVQGASTTYTRKVCHRKPATPYGFGFDLNALSGKQIAVLAALGLSRA